MSISIDTKQQAQDLLDFIDSSPSPWHAVSTTVDILKKNGFKLIQHTYELIT